MKIGVVGPFTGSRSAYGKLLRRAISRASQGVENINWIVCDDRADPIQSKNAAEYLIKQGVTAVIGHFNSECALLVAGLYESAQIPFLAPASTHPDLTSLGKEFVFRICPTDTQQIDRVSRFIKRHDLTQTLVVSDGSFYGNSLASRLDFPKSSSYQAVFFCGSHINSSKCLSEYRRQGFSGAFIASDDSKIEDFIRLANGNTENTYVLGFRETYEEACFFGAKILATLLGRYPNIRHHELSNLIRQDHFSENGERLGTQWSVWEINLGQFVELQNA